MRIKLAILDRDVKYLKRITALFSARYTEQIETYSFTDPDMAQSVLSSSKIDVLLANEEFDIDPGTLPKRCSLAYLADSPDITTLNGQTAVGKFQKPELMYRQILSLYAEKTSDMSEQTEGAGKTDVISFTSPAGGVGSSTLAAACAAHFALRGERCLYLSLEPFGSADAFFSGEGQFGLSDVIFALKSRKSNFPLKLESCVKKSGQGVFFYTAPRVALDILELNEEETLQLIQALRQTGSYDHIILDFGFDLSQRVRNIHRQAGTVVWVSDGSELANDKLRRAYESLTIREENEDIPLTERLCVAYNRFSSKTGRQAEDLPLKVIGGAPRYENRTAEQVMAELAQLDLFEQLV